MVGNRWVAGPPLPVKVTASTAEVVGGDVYLFGGHHGSGRSSTIYVLKEKSNNWQLVQGRLNQNRAAHVSVSIMNMGMTIDYK